MKYLFPLTGLVIATASAITPTTSDASTPICQFAVSDNDGDGWGWENHRSCVVAESSASVAVANAAAQPSANVGSSQKPVCTNAASDPDGDGWGWENNASCVVTVNTQAGSSDNNEDSTEESGLPQEVVEEEAVDEDPVEEEEETPEGAAADSAEATSEEFPDIVNGLYLGRVPVCSSPSSDVDGDGWGFEFHESCKVVEGYVIPGSIPDVDPEGNDINQKVGIVYEQDFDLSDTGLYQADQLNSEWQSPFWHLGFDQGRVNIVDVGGNRGNAMQVTYPAGKYGAGGASAFLSDVQFGMGLPKTYEELYVAYDIRFADGFDFVKGGKLPGLCGADVTQAPSTGCNTGGGYPTGYDGWSARGMWREDGVLENYVYHASQRNYYGDDEFWNVSATPGVWHRVQHRVVLNTPGIKNGILEAWFDGTKVLSLKNLEFRKTNNIGINLFYFSTFFGGNDASWAPSTDQTMDFDNFVLSTDLIQ